MKKAGGVKTLKAGNPLKDEEAGTLAEWITSFEDEQCARLLLLCHAFTYETDISRRENMLRETEARLGPFLPGFDRMQGEDMAACLTALRAKKGGSR